MWLSAGIDSKESSGVGVQDFVELRERDAADFGEFLCGVAGHVGCTGASRALWFGAEVGRIGLDHESIQRHKFGGFAHFGCAAVGEYAGERDTCTEVQKRAHVGE